jgi:hypothetical protein
MDRSRITFVFDQALDPDEVDVDDELVTESQLRAAYPDAEDTQLLVRSILAKMILHDDPPVVWETVERLRALGMARGQIWNELSIACIQVLQEVLAGDNAGLSDERLRERFEQLPVPTAGELERSIVSTIGNRSDIDLDDLGEIVRAQIGFSQGDPADLVYERVLDEMLDTGEVTLIGDNIVVDPVRLAARSVFTHRLTEAERAAGMLHLGPDLGIFGPLDHVHLDDLDEGEIAEATTGLDEAGIATRAWIGPEGWLDDLPAGCLLAVRVEPGDLDDGNHRLFFDVIDDETNVANDRQLVTLVGELAARESANTGLPVPAESLVCALLAELPGALSEPHRPLAELCAEAGLEVRGERIGVERAQWYHEAIAQRLDRVLGEIEDDDLARRAIGVLMTLDAISGADPSWLPDPDADVDDARIRTVLRDLEDPGLLTVVTQETFSEPPPDDPTPGMPGTPQSAAAIIRRLVDVARSGPERMVAHWFAAIAAERSCDPHAAEQHLEIAHAADPDNPLPVDRLAWCAFDRGDADRAEALWSRLEPTETITQDLREVAEARRLRGRQPGRNDPCWCGSGRKFKQCHNGQASLPPLPERVGWLCRKASTFLERRGGIAQAAVVAMARSRALDPTSIESLGEAFGDPLVIDLVLTEGGFFERFLDERGALLPDDELLLARSWTLVDRNVFEVLSVQPGVGMTLRDLRSGAEVVVRERTLSNQVSPGMLCCARPVPDGETHQFVGGIFGVRVGEEARVLDLCDAKDPFAIARWVADSHRPPTISNREGHEMVQCNVVLTVRDAAAARRVLDRSFDPDGPPSGGPDRWVDLADVDGRGEEFILRAHLRLEGREIHIETNSEWRMERVLNIVTSQLRSAKVVRDEREPIDPARYLAEVSAGQGADGSPRLPLAMPDDPAVLATLHQMRERFEERWCDEPVPALGGVTPREAAADPTRRESLERLIRSFEAMPDLGGPVGAGMRPERLRELLGLDPSAGR